MIGTSTRSRGNIFQLNLIEMTCFVAKVDINSIWHKRSCHINFDNIVKEISTFVGRDLPKIVKPTNMVCKGCVMAKQHKSSYRNKKLTTINELTIEYHESKDDSSSHGNSITLLLECESDLEVRGDYFINLDGF